MEQARSDKSTQPPSNSMGWRAAGMRPATSSQIQRVTQRVDLNSLTTGTRKDWFLLVPQDSSLQRLLVSAAADTALTGVLTLKMVQAVNGSLVDLSENHILSRLSQSPVTLRANRAWRGEGAVYLAVTGTQQALELLATVEYLTSEIP